MLSNISIKKYLESGDIEINPWVEEMMDAARVTLHLGEKILEPQPNYVVDVEKGTLPVYKEIVLTKDRPFELHPGAFILGETFEQIGLSQKIGMLMDGRSTLARLGITVTQTAMIIDSGQKPKQMTLEIKNGGANVVMLYPKMKFCRACFFLIDPPATLRYDTKGKYATNDPLKPIFVNEFD